jgi:hypothetical protein
MPPYVSDSTSAPGPVNQLISFQETDGDSSGVGHVSRTLGDQMYGPIHVALVRRDRLLEFDKGGERLS